MPVDACVFFYECKGCRKLLSQVSARSAAKGLLRVGARGRLLAGAERRCKVRSHRAPVARAATDAGVSRALVRTEAP